MEKARIYQMFPRYWGNIGGANVRGGSLVENGSGHFSDVDDASLEYFTWLGITHIWFTGVLRHATGESVPGVDAYDVQPDYVKGKAGSPYAVSDYYQVNPYLAGSGKDPMTEFCAMLGRTHAHGLKAIIDFIPNHVSPCYRDDHGGIPTFPWCDYDWTDTRKIDYGAPGTWDRMYDILRFWAGKGVDGFRCDMVELVPPEFFSWAIRRLKAEFPGLVFIAEVYDMDSYWRYVNEVGFDLLYDKSGLYDSLVRILRQGGSAEQITWNWQRLGDLQSHMLNFVENHDEKRAASCHFAGTGSKALAAASVGALFNDASFMIYEGQEIGERGLEDAGWSGPDGRSTIYDWWSIDSLSRLKSVIDSAAYAEDGAGPLVQSGLSVKEACLLNRYHQMMALSAELDSGNYDLGYCNDFDRSSIFAFARRTKAGKAILAVANFSDKKQRLSVNVPQDAFTCLGVEIPAQLSYKVTVPASDFSVVQM